jgi:hypothetical protein
LDRNRQVNLAPLVNKGFTVTAHSLAIHGLCQKCGREQSKKSRARRVQRAGGGQVGRMAVDPQQRRRGMGDRP